MHAHNLYNILDMKCLAQCRQALCSNTDVEASLRTLSRCSLAEADHGVVLLAEVPHLRQ